VTDPRSGGSCGRPSRAPRGSVEGVATSATRLSDYDYDLPPELIAQTPAMERDAARLLVLERGSGAVAHAVVRDLPRLLRAGDLLVLNDARVRPARLYCRTASGGAVELLVVREREPGVWSCLGRPAKRLRAGTSLILPGGGAAVVRARTDPGRYAIEVGPAVDLPALLAQSGELPLPPYIKRPDGPLALDRERYQTVFAARDGAVAAPTAGLHFTPALLAALERAGVQRAAVSLAVGPGTFLPVRVEDVSAHQMDAEWAELPAATIDAVERTKSAGGRVIAVGTTTTRALESALGARAARPPMEPHDACSGLAARAAGFWADAFIRPGFRFQVIDGLLTNFHLPRSTLLMLVCAFAGRERVLDTYAVAVRERYRFYSYGDAMLIC
jgi:S-adenosylmethionine:tRNA ribosyltransferase-isomerase